MTQRAAWTALLACLAAFAPPASAGAMDVFPSGGTIEAWSDINITVTLPDASRLIDAPEVIECRANDKGLVCWGPLCDPDGSRGPSPVWPDVTIYQVGASIQYDLGRAPFQTFGPYKLGVRICS